MGLFDSLRNYKKRSLGDSKDSRIVAFADGKGVNVNDLSDPMFAEQMLGRTVAFQLKNEKVTIHSPANGVLSVLYPTGHAFGITMHNGVELLVHIGIDSVENNGNGFKLLKKKQGDIVSVGEAIVEVDMINLSAKYDMSTMLIVTNSNGMNVTFIDIDEVKCGQRIASIE